MNEIAISTQKKRCQTSRDLYGIFFEDINRVGDGGLYPEMLRNRSFEDSLVPEGCRMEEDGRYFITPTGYRSAFNHGEGLDAWCAAVPPTDIPAWYVSDNKKTEISLDFAHTLNDNRKSALAIRFAEGGTGQSVLQYRLCGHEREKGRVVPLLYVCRIAGSQDGR